MARKKISAMTAASAYTGANEFYELVQGGNTRQGSHALLKTYFDTLYAPAVLRYTSSAQTITTAGSLTLAHGLGVRPFYVSAYLECVTAEKGYSIGDRVYHFFANSSSVADGYGLSISTNGSTNIDIRYGSQGIVFLAPDKTTGLVTGLTNANWRLYVIAEA